MWPLEQQPVPEALIHTHHHRKASYWWLLIIGVPLSILPSGGEGGRESERERERVGVGDGSLIARTGYLDF